MYPPPPGPAEPPHVPPSGSQIPGSGAPGHPPDPYGLPGGPPAPYGPPVPGPPSGPTTPPAFHTPPSGPSRVRRFWSIWGSIGAVAVTWLCTMVGVAMSVPTEMSGAQAAIAFLWFVVAAGYAAAVWWRTSHPVTVCLATAALGIVSPLGAVAPLIALPWVVARAELRRSLLCGAATALAVGAAFWRDAGREGAEVIFSTAPDPTGAISYLTPTGYVIIGLLALGLAVGVGLLRRIAARAGADAAEARSAATAESRRADTFRAQSESLRTELSRQEERDLIAREMHDTVAHQLSLMSLQASALEVSSDDADTGDTARSMRSSAHRALEEMRTLITSLREGAEDYAGRDWTLDDLADLLDGAGSSGVDLVATVFVANGDTAPPTLTRTVYRVVQESLTNAAKHSPGARVAVSVRARPGDGIDLSVRNLTGAAAGPGAAVAPPAVPGSGSGLRGMRERCETLGGSFDAGRQDDGSFLVRAHLPWSPSPLP